MSESDMWARVRPVILSLDPIRIESLIGLGISDVNYREGWIELKQVPKWPVRQSTSLKVNHFTPEQRTWIRERAEKGRKVWMLLHVEGADDWLLFKGKLGPIYLGQATEAVLRKVACKVWRGTPTPDLVGILS